MPPNTLDSSQKTKQQKKAKGKACKQQAVSKQLQNATAEQLQHLPEEGPLGSLSAVHGDQANSKVNTQLVGVAGAGRDADLPAEAKTAAAAAAVIAGESGAEGGTGAKAAPAAAASRSAALQGSEVGGSSSSAVVAGCQGHHAIAAGRQDCLAPSVPGATAAAAVGKLPECRTAAVVAMPGRAPAAGAGETPPTGQGAVTAAAAATGGETTAAGTAGTAATAVGTGLGAAAPATAAAQVADSPVSSEASSTLGGSSIGAVAARKARRPRKRAECVVCLDAPAEVLLLPCKHVILCVDCSQLVQAAGKPCPICCTPVEQHVAGGPAHPAGAAHASLPDVPAAAAGGSGAAQVSLDLPAAGGGASAAAARAARVGLAAPALAGAATAAQVSLDVPASAGAALAGATVTCLGAVPGMDGGAGASYRSRSSRSTLNATSSSSGMSYSSNTHQIGAAPGSEGAGSAKAVPREVTDRAGRSALTAADGLEGSEKSAELTALLQTLLAGPGSTRGSCSSRSHTGVQDVLSPPVVGMQIRTTKNAAPCTSTAAALVTSTYAASSSSSSLSSAYMLQSGGHDAMPPVDAIRAAGHAAPACANGAVMSANEGEGQLEGLSGQTAAVPGRSASFGTCAAADVQREDSQCQDRQLQEEEEQQVGYREFVQEAAGILGEARGQVLQVLGVLDQTMGRLKLLCDRYGVPVTDVLPYGR